MHMVYILASVVFIFVILYLLGRPVFSVADWTPSLLSKQRSAMLPVLLRPEVRELGFAAGWKPSIAIYIYVQPSEQ